jgi:DNA helicase-2/ATP-dependent DNA helicase PcrA
MHLRSIGRIDFDHIVLGSLILVTEHEHVRRALVAKYPWFVIDEYQDLGLALHRMVGMLLDKTDVNVFAVGDPDQSIYTFSGARPEFLDELAKRTDVRPVRLELNYRCGQKIIDASLHVLQPEETRNFLSVHEGDKRGEIVFKGCKEGLGEQAVYVVAQIGELIKNGVPPAEIGVFAKRWGDLATCVTALAEAGIPYRIVRGRAYKATPLTGWVESMATWCAGGWRSGKPRMEDLFVAWERFSRARSGSSGTSSDLAGRVTLYKSLSSLRAPTMPVARWIEAVDAALDLGAAAANPNAVPLRQRYDVRELSAMLTSLSSGDVAEQTLAEFTGIDQDKVVLQSLHSSKGLEYTVVFMLALEDGVIPQYKEDPRAARRLFYVGMTRAKREVHLLWSGFYFNSQGKRNDQGHSPFLPELWKRLNPS